MIRGAVLVLLSLSATAATAKDASRPQPSAPRNGCEWAGPGFVKLEGSDTCVKVGGGVRAEFSTSSTGTSTGSWK